MRLKPHKVEASMPTYTLQRGNTLLLQGPALIRLQDGSANCLAAPLPSRDWAFVEKWRQVPVYAAETSTLEIKLGPGSSRKEIRGSTIPTGWNEASQILQQSPGVVVIIGDVDSGKSSLCTFLTNESIKVGLKVAVIDADVGQADMGPPTTIGSSRAVEPTLGLQELKAQTSFFIGDTSPSSVPEKLIQSLVRLKEDLVGRNDIVIVNTDGWIGDPLAIRYKLRLLAETKPNIVLGLARGRELDPILDIVPSTSLRLESSGFAKIRTREDRKHAREAGYRRFLNGSKPLRMRVEDVRVRMFDQPEQTLFAGERNFRGLIAGLLGADNVLIALGRVKEVLGGMAVVETQTKETPSVLELGSVVLSSNYEEVGYNVLH